MIKFLRINNIALVSSLELELSEGLTLLTGETGAGKSILIDALGLLLGERASADLLRTGEERALIEGIFVAPAAKAALESHGIPVEDEEVVIRRELQATGKGRATVNGALVPVGILKDLGPHLAIIHGQHEPQGLLDPASHLELLDAHVGDPSLKATIAAAYRQLRNAQGALERFERDRREGERRREMLEFQAGEIRKAALSAGEEEALRREKALQANAGRLATLSGEAYSLLYDDETAVVASLGQVYRRIEELGAIDPAFAPYLEARSGIHAQLEDLAFFLRDYRERIQVSPGRLDEIEARLALIERLKRKYGETVEDVIAFGEKCTRDLEDLGQPEERQRQLAGEVSAATREYLEVAERLSKLRRASARDLEKRVSTELTQLAMEKTRFEVRFIPEETVDTPGDSTVFSELGLESVEFLISPNPGEELRPLARIASGGELSRIMLALKSVASADAKGKTQVFDEVDAGIGGGVAEVVGRKLKRIAGTHQVLCVTHLPQIASLADAHWVVRKRVERGRTLTEVEKLTAADRIGEIARMLGGETVTEAARRHAREMINQGSRS
jgi:DNA repair protein RecN (Recombination protein N)